MSIAVMRAFVNKRKEEHELRLSQKKNTMQVDSEKDVSKSVGEEASNEPAVNGHSNGDCEMAEVISECKPSRLREELSKIIEGKGRGELKPPRVLEVLAGHLI